MRMTADKDCENANLKIQHFNRKGREERKEMAVIRSLPDIARNWEGKILLLIYAGGAGVCRNSNDEHLKVRRISTRGRSSISNGGFLDFAQGPLSLEPLEDEESVYAEGPDGKCDDEREHIGDIEDRTGPESPAMAFTGGKT